MEIGERRRKRRRTKGRGKDEGEGRVGGTERGGDDGDMKWANMQG